MPSTSREELTRLGIKAMIRFCDLIYSELKIYERFLAVHTHTETVSKVSKYLCYGVESM